MTIDSTRSARPVLEVKSVVQEFVIRDQGGVKGGTVQALSGVSFEVAAGEALGIVGESGSGKSTLARAVMQSPKPKSGSVVLDGIELTGLRGGHLRAARRRMQMIFQDPVTSLDPRMRVRDVVEEPLIAAGLTDRKARKARVAEVLELVELDPLRHGQRFPRQLSGGQSQRVAIARAIVASPAMLICDEPVSSLDVMIQAQVLNLFETLRAELGLAYLFIAHDLAVVRQLCDRVAVVYLGKICEIGPADTLFAQPRHPYTAALLSAIPSTDPERPAARIAAHVKGEVPSALNPPSGCRFRTRCPRAQQRCADEIPELIADPTGRQVACHFPLEAVGPVARHLHPDLVTGGSESLISTETEGAQ